MDKVEPYIKKADDFIAKYASVTQYGMSFINAVYFVSRAGIGHVYVVLNEWGRVVSFCILRYLKWWIVVEGRLLGLTKQDRGMPWKEQNRVRYCSVDEFSIREGGNHGKDPKFSASKSLPVPRPLLPYHWQWFIQDSGNSSTDTLHSRFRSWSELCYLLLTKWLWSVFSILSSVSFSRCRKIQGIGGQDRLPQGLFLCGGLRLRHPFGDHHGRNETRIQPRWLFVPCLHVLQGIGRRQGHRRWCHTVDDVLDYLLLHQPYGRYFPIFGTIHQHVLFHQNWSRCLVVPPQDHGRTSHLQFGFETLPSSFDAGDRHTVQEGLNNKLIRIQTISSWYRALFDEELSNHTTLLPFLVEGVSIPF